MASPNIHIAVTEKGNILVGTRFITTKMIEGVKIVKEIWQHPPSHLTKFLIDNKNKESLMYNALAYWARCIIRQQKAVENAYGNLKRELYEYSQELYSAVRSFARHIATEVQKFFKKQQKQFKKLQKIKRQYY